MLFDYGDDVFESYKERNLYYKFFAGYFLNEKIEGFDGRFKSLLNLLNKKNVSAQNIQLDLKTTHLTFDNYIHQFKSGFNPNKNENDRGEFADIFLFDRALLNMVAIEAKFLQKLGEKDYVDNTRRLKHFMEKGIRVSQFFLIIGKVYRKMSNRERAEIKGRNISVITWEQLFSLVKDEEIREYFRHQISFMSKRQWQYEINEKGIHRKK